MNKSLKKVADNIINFLLKPFQENFETMIILSLFAGSADGFFWTVHSFERLDINLFFGAYMFLHSFVQTYFIVLLCGFLGGKSLKVARIILYTLGFINLCLDTGIHIIMQCGFIGDFVAIMMGTNANETKEFLGMYINWKMILFILTVSAIAVCVHIFFKAKQRKPSRLIAVCGIFLLVATSTVLIVRKSDNWEGVFLMKIKTVLDYKPTPDLRKYSRKYELTVVEPEPSNVILIIGESLNKGHMSLYGYDKKTTPFLDSLDRSGQLYSFDNVKSSGIGTVPAFKYMMTSLTPKTGNCDLTKSIFLLDVVKSAGYDTRWISNQAPSGVHDNIVARFAELSDSVVWCGTKYMGNSKKDLDEDILEPVLERANSSEGLNFTVVHLCGNHEDFKSRYSEDFEVFSPSEYTHKPKSQRQILASYDNSVLYNDWIVTSIFDIYKDKEAVIIYLPDHSLDIFDSSPDYAGHARGDDPSSVDAGKNIPFIIYTTNEYRESHPESDAKFTAEKHDYFETENLLDAIMDVIGVEFSDKQSAE